MTHLQLVRLGIARLGIAKLRAVSATLGVTSSVGSLVSWGFTLNPVAVAAAAGLSRLVGLVSAILPDRSAARLDPIASLRCE